MSKAMGTKEKTDCTRLLSAICHNSTLVAAKTIRTPLYLVEGLLDALPKLKVVFYTRDPRGIILSRYPNSFSQPPGFQVRQAKILCDVLATESDYAAKLAAKYPERFIQLQYEQLAMNPLDVAAELYSYVGKPLPVTVSQWIVTHTDRHLPGILSTSRVSSATADRWRQVIGPLLAERMLRVCSVALKSLGYQD